jgi:hypothetical protein
MLKKILQHYNLGEELPEEKFPVNFFPVPPKYIVYQTGSEKKSQVYDYSVEVLSLVKESLEKAGITLIQVGDLDDPLIFSNLDLRGQLSARQLGYVIQNSLLCVTSNKFSARLCRTFNKPLVLLGSNFPSSTVVPEFKLVTYIEPELKTPRWSYKDDEKPKSINLIKPEMVASTILQKLGLENNIKFKTVFVGEKFGPQILEFIPDFNLPQDLVGKQLNVRLDVFFNPESLPVLSEHCKIFITTKEPFDLMAVNTSNVNSISYFCDQDVDIKFIKDCIKKKIKTYAICSNVEHLNELRFKLLGILEVYKKIEQKPLDISSFYGILFKSSRIYIGRGQIFPSLYHYKNNYVVDILGSPLNEAFSNNQDFLEARESLYVFSV